MKNILATVICGSLALGAFAQTEQPEVPLMILNMTDGTNQEIPLSDIKNVTFRLPSEEPEPEPYPVPVPTVYQVVVPNDLEFLNSRVMKAVDDEGKKIAEICNEYILSIDAVKTVIYPVDADGKADLTKGILAENGGSVVWDTATNSATVTDGTEEIKVFYVDEEGNILFAIPEAHNPEGANVVADLLVDTRGGETLKYKIVKIGTQYWMAENLRAKNYADGTSITQYTGNDADAWQNDTEGAYKLPSDDSSAAGLFGMFYNGFAVTSEKGLAPDGWAVPTADQWNLLKTASSKVAYLKATSGWPEGKDGTDETGFDAIPTGYYSKATGESGLLTETYWWSSTQYYDALTRGDNLDYARITGTGTRMTVSSSTLGGHSLQFGHVVRCVRR